MTGERTSMIVNGPSCLVANLEFRRAHFRCCPSTHTFDPFLKGWKFHQVLLFMVCLVRSWAARASFLMARREFSQSWTAGMGVSEIMVGRAWGSYPIMRKNGNWLVTE